MRRSSARPLTVLLGIAVTATVALSTAAPALAWENGGQGSGPANQGNGYGTHDWILDQALRTAGSKGAWLDAPLARSHTDDPDYARRDFDHAFMESGDGRGAAQVTADLYAKAVQAYAQGDRETASTDVGLLAHYVGDVSQPYHTAVAAIGLDAHHALLEDLVEAQTQSSSATVGASLRHDWTAPRAAKSTGSIRAAVINEAAYSRPFFPAVEAEMSKNPTSISPTLNAIVAKLLSTDANTLGDIIATIPTGKGLAPDVAHLTASVEKPFAGRSSWQIEDAHATDSGGRPIEGLEIDFTYPTAPGVTPVPVRKFTDVDGNAHYSVVLGSLPYDASYPTLAEAVTSPGTTHAADLKVRGSFMVTRQLIAGTAGFSDTLSNHSPTAGSKVTATSTAVNTDGLPQKGLVVSYTWPWPSGSVTTTATTDSAGHASSTVTVPSSASGHTLTLAVATQAGGYHRYSSNALTAK